MLFDNRRDRGERSGGSSTKNSQTDKRLLEDVRSADLQRYYSQVNERNSIGMCVFCGGVGVQTLELAIPVNSFTNINTPVSMEEAAEPEQGVLGITELI